MDTGKAEGETCAGDVHFPDKLCFAVKYNELNVGEFVTFPLAA